MWVCASQTQNIQMTEGDYGIVLPIIVQGVAFAEHDEAKIKIVRGATVLLEKTFGNITNNTISVILTEAESTLLTVGNYQYSLDWYQDGAFMCNIIPRSLFKVVDKA